MGCTYSTLPCVRQGRSQQTGGPTLSFSATVLHKAVAPLEAPLCEAPCSSSRVLSPEQVLSLCSTACRTFFPGQDHITLAAIALVESSGQPTRLAERATVGETACGLCQVLLSTARWLSSEHACTAFGTPQQRDLLEPEKNLYYCGSYLQLLRSHLGQEQPEEFVVRAYHAGPKNADSSAAQLYWHKVSKAVRLLRRLQDALDAAARDACTDTAPPSPRLMHVMQPGDSLARLAAVCSVSVDDIMRANSDLGSPAEVRTYDCIALPVARVLPRVYAVQPGDTLASIAVAHRTTAGRLLELNPELQLLGKLPVGWVLALPGLRDYEEPASEAERSRRWQLATTHSPPAPAPFDGHREPVPPPINTHFPPLPPVPVF